MKMERKMFTYAKKLSKLIATVIFILIAYTVFVYAKAFYLQPDFGKSFGKKASDGEKKLSGMKNNFAICAAFCESDAAFMQSLVFPEVMRYNSLKDDVETESLKMLYVQFGSEYANFSIGIFQMKPTFAETVETKAKQLLPDSLYRELQLIYSETGEENIRRERINRLQEEDWQLVYLTAFINICNKIYSEKQFSSAVEKMQWYATVYNAGFDKTDDYIRKKLQQDNFYLNQDMPGKKFKYAAIAAWFYNKTQS